MVKLVKLSIVWCEMGTETGVHARRFLGYMSRIHIKTDRMNEIRL